VIFEQQQSETLYRKTTPPHLINTNSMTCVLPELATSTNPPTAVEAFEFTSKYALASIFFSSRFSQFFKNRSGQVVICQQVSATDAATNSLHCCLCSAMSLSESFFLFPQSFHTLTHLLF